MRTKTLLIAAAALAATVISSEAQTVFSANVVGYVNQSPGAGIFTLVANPLDNGAGNVLSNVFAPTTIGGTTPGATVIEVWNAANGSFDNYKLVAGHWKNTDFNTNADNLVIAPGTGLFISPPSAFTNTYVGSVVAPVGGSTTNTVPIGVQLVSSQIPYADFVTNTSTFNLTVAGATVLQQWDPVAQAYVDFKFVAGNWKNTDLNVAQVPKIGVGEGFFLTPPVVPNVWVQNLTNN